MDTAIVLECARVDTGGVLFPDVPSGWTAKQEDNGWFTLCPDTGGFLHARLMCARATPATSGFVVAGIAADVLTLLTFSAEGAWVVADFRTDVTEPAVTFQGLWVDPDPGLLLEATIAGYDHPATLEATATLPS